MDPVELLRGLVEIPSPSFMEERACAFLVENLGCFGWERVIIDGAGNVVAVRGTGPSVVALVGHVDTVPGGPAVRMEAGELWGRGTVDAKGPLCALAVAGGAVEVPPGVSLVFIGAVGEEEDSRGARHALTWLKGVRALLVGEPTGSDGVAVSYRGRLLAEFYASDGGSHRSCHRGPLTDVLVQAARAVEAVSSMEGFSCAVAMMEGVDVGERSARVRLDVRVPLGSSVEVARDVLSAGTEGVSIRVLEAIEPHGVGSDDLVVRAMRRAIRSFRMTPRLLSKMGTCDMNVLAPLGCPMGVYGPGDSRLDHTDEERLRVEDYLKSIEVLRIGLTHITAEVCG
ncbi:N-acetyl-ornithine/N-acetyl-lysine deacetylase [Thermanaerovibrio velox DSM 12556]|uniref:N-acetyl-ornithine/N-acetyl-lysine deacetylase n=1 Tax=Thermanaerovibrio velox DSM 12556 TaxID=926567 RepID=H0UNR2_9BACT|nr:M20/M25/M40 family metallo-hydrolase [Thermanaerovibrio velox]EHM10477.1 N-acetyl-ornithine/N-acetyl-lysine deacetylase [Thermanaerovibrio velox DSM 12556]